MFKTAIITSASGGDPQAMHDEAAHLWTLGVREVVLTHCINVFDDAADSWRLQGDAEDVFEQQMNAFESRHMRVRTEVPLGHPAMSLREVSRNHSAGLIVVEAGNTALFGSGLPDDHSTDVVALSETPVLLRPTRSSVHSVQAMTDRILLATDFSSTADRAFETLLDVVRVCRSCVDVLHVQEPTTLLYGAASEASQYDQASTVRIARLKERLIAAGAREVATKIVSGDPVDELAASARSGRYGLIVMGSRGCSGQSNGVLGDVSGPLVRDSGVSILMVPPARERVEMAVTAHPF